MDKKTVATKVQHKTNTRSYIRNNPKLIEKISKNLPPSESSPLFAIVISFNINNAPALSS
ncbi:MAG: hypothetical protein KAG28_01805 [Cocleimonas sp.]|nr:hypothetical protein [Cocleimonas sp.]